MQTAPTSAEIQRLDALAQKILDTYNLSHPPVPIETILQHPPTDLLPAVDITDLSLVFGMGEHRYEYRVAIARLLYRELCRHKNEPNEALPYTNDAARYFAAALLIPAEWALKYIRRPLVNLQQISETFQVPDYMMASRLAQMGKRIRGM